MSWRKVKIGDFLVRSKIPINIEDYKDYKRVTIRINHNGVSLRDTEKGRKIGTKKQFMLKAGQFILSKIDARYGAFGIAPDEVDGAIITGNFWAYDFDKRQINIEWLNQYTNSPEFYEICERASSGITHRKYLNESSLLNHEILLPDEDEQKLVINGIKKLKLSFGILKSEIGFQKESMNQLRQAFLKEAMQGKLVPQNPDDEPASELLKRIKAEKEQLISHGKLKKEKPLPHINPEDIPFEIPENWTWSRLGEISNVITSGSRDWAKYYSKSGAKFIRMGNLSRGKFELRMQNVQHVNPPINSEGNRTKLEQGDILISITGDVGNLGLVPFDFGKAYINQHTGLVRLNSMIEVKCIAYFFLSAFLQEQFNAPQRGLKNSFRLSDIDNLLIPLPPSKEQSTLVSKLDQLMAICDELEQDIQQNQKYTQELMQVALKEALTNNSII